MVPIFCGSYFIFEVYTTFCISKIIYSFNIILKNKDKKHCYAGFLLSSLGFKIGKNSTSFIVLVLANSMQSLSRPIPHPAVGGKPYMTIYQIR